MPRPLRIAWLGGSPLESGGAPGVATELLDGLARRGHTIDCFFPGAPRAIPERLTRHERLTFIWGTSEWRWKRWYSRTKVAAFASGLFARGFASVRLRRAILARHAKCPYDLIYQNQMIESLGVPRAITREIPLVIRPDTHQAGELRWLIAERRLAFRCQPRYVFFIVATIMGARTLVQRVRIQRASLVICISRVFRDHIVRDYRFPRERTVVVTNPVRLERFEPDARPPGDPALILVPTRISMRKGLEDVVALAGVLERRGVPARLRIVGGPSIWSDYTKLLDDLPANAEYGGSIAPSGMPGELEAADIVLLASRYDPCGMSVLEGLAAGRPAVATDEVGAIEDVERSVAAAVTPGDVAGMADAVTAMIERLRADPAGVRGLARAEAERLFAPDVVCGQISDALEQLVAARAGGQASA